MHLSAVPTALILKLTFFYKTLTTIRFAKLLNLNDIAPSGYFAENIMVYTVNPVFDENKNQLSDFQIINLM
jgi:hypothetical protein